MKKLVRAVTASHAWAPKLKRKLTNRNKKGMIDNDTATWLVSVLSPWYVA